MKTAIVAGTRPNFIKIAPLLEAAAGYPEMDITLVHTGQHYNYEMSRAFFDQLGIREPDIFLEVGSGMHGEQTSRIMSGFEKVLEDIEPDQVVVVGDVNSTVACAITATKFRYGKETEFGMKRPLIAHVESGLRSFDRSMPEEINRLLTDRLSDYLFTTCEDANRNLRREGIPEDRIHFTGNVMIDTLLKNLERAKLPPFLDRREAGYALLTLHRPSNVDRRDTIESLIAAVSSIAGRIPVIFPAHPRTQKMLALFGLEGRLAFCGQGSDIGTGPINVTDPLPYLEFIAMVKNAALVLTDSGGIQEETTVLGIPCLTLRKNTERPITVEIGTNIVVGTGKERIVEEAGKILDGNVKQARVPELWDGHAAARILKILAAK